MIPVHTLTPEEAVLELERLCDLKPPDDQPCELHHWRQAHEARVRELEAWILIHPSQEPAQIPPPPQELPMPPQTPSAKAKERLDEMLAKYSRTIELAVTAPDEREYMKAVGRCYYYRSQIHLLVKTNDLEEPRLFGVPPNPWKGRTLKSPPAAAASEPAAVAPAAPATESPAEPGRRNPSPQSLGDMRRAIWLRLAEMESASSRDWDVFRSDLAMLIRASQAAHDFATKKLEVP